MNTPIDPYETDEYAKFVASMAAHCHADLQNRPCESCLAGGMCDGTSRDTLTEDDFDRDEY